MDLNIIKEIAAKLMCNRRASPEQEKGKIFYHGQRVANTAIQLRMTVLPGQTDLDDTLTVAAWFHNAAEGMEPHDRYGILIAKEALRNHCSGEELQEILTLIELHGKRNPGHNDYSPSVKLLQDADLLDHYGTYTIWADLIYSASHEKSVMETAALDKEEWADHCKKSKAFLNYPVSREIFDEKTRFVSQFYERFQTEGAGGIFGYHPKRFL